jgi:hypothetical protein
MRIILVVVLAVVLMTEGAAGQVDGGVTLSHYIFENFHKGRVRLKSGSVNEEELNYNSLTSEMVFNDHGKYLAIANPMDVDTITILDRQFVPAGKGFYEVLAPGPAPLYLEYTCTIKDPGADIGYGMSSTTSATTQLKSLIQSGGAYNLKLPDGFQPIPQRNFLILRNGKFLPANNVRQLGLAFPDKKAWINQYVKDKHPDLKKTEDLVALVRGLEQ